MEGIVQTLLVDRMIGKEVTIPDIVLELQELVQPIDLHCYEDLQELPDVPSEDSEEEQVERIPYKIVAPCGGCGARLRLFVIATFFGIRTQQELLIQEVQLVCPQCREVIRNGGQGP